MYRILVLIAFIGLLIRLFFLIKSRRLKSPELLNNVREDFILPIKNVFKISSSNTKLFEVLRNLFYSLTSIFFMILALTGFFPVIIYGEHLSGLLLIIHVTIAPFFVFSLMFAILFWANYQQYNSEDFSSIKNIHPESGVSGFWEKTTFWLFSILSLPAILSMILSMYPIFGTDGQIFMLSIHRYTVLLLLIIASFFIFTKYTSQLVSDKMDRNE